MIPPPALTTGRFAAERASRMASAFDTSKGIPGWCLRRAGLGTKLVEAAEAWALMNGFAEIASDTELDNGISLQAHLALGFEEVERQICFKKSLLSR